MTSKEYLTRVGIIEKMISSKMKDVEYWRHLAENICGIDLEEHHNPNRREEATFAHCIEKIAEIQEEIDKQTAELISLRNEIERRISLLDNLQEQLVLRSRYLNHMGWEEISAVMEICERSAFRVHRKALLHFSVPEPEVSSCQ